MKTLSLKQTGAAKSRNSGKYSIKQFSELVMGILENKYDCAEVISENVYECIQAYAFDEGKNSRTYAHASFVAMRLYNEAQHIGLGYELTYDDFWEAMATACSEEAEEIYINKDELMFPPRGQQEIVFPNIIGLEGAKSQIVNLIEESSNRKINPVMITGKNGSGKTSIARSFARNFTDVLGDPPRFIELNCATIKNKKHFMEMIVEPHLFNVRAVVCFDQPEKMPKKLWDMFSELYLNDPRMMGINVCVTSTKSFQGVNWEWETEIETEPLSNEEIAEVISLNSELGLGGKIKFDFNVADEIAPHFKGNGRAAQKMTTNIKAYLSPKGGRTFKLSDWNKLCRILDVKN